MRLLFPFTLSLVVLLSSCYSGDGFSLSSDDCDECRFVGFFEEVKGEILIFQWGTLSYRDKSETFNYCPNLTSTSFKSREAYKITGKLHSNCDGVAITVDSWAHVKYCPPEIILTDEDVDLFGKWNILDIRLNNEIIKTPCETPGEITFLKDSAGIITYQADLTQSTMANGTINRVNNTLSIARECREHDFLFLNENETIFLDAFCQIISTDSSSIKFDINKNLMNMRNIENGVELNLYKPNLN